MKIKNSTRKTKIKKFEYSFIASDTILDTNVQQFCPDRSVYRWRQFIISYFSN